MSPSERKKSAEREKQARDLLHHAMVFARSLLDLIVNKIPCGLSVEDPEGRYLLVNDAFSGMLALRPDDLIGRLAEDLIVEPGRAALRKDYLRLRSGEARAISTQRTCRRRDGSTCRIRFDSEVVRDRDGYPLCVLTLAEDEGVQMRRLQEQIKLGKFEALTLFAGGVSHDLNNILQVIGANLELSLLNPAARQSAGQFLEDSLAATRRGSELARKLQIYSRSGEPALAPARLESLLNNAASFAAQGSNVAVRCSFPPELPPVAVDAGEFTQVVDNLVINAREAMPDGGELVLAGRVVALPAANRFDLPAGRYVEISFTDSGPGIAPEIRARIFDPYVSTKTRGSGLGLATSLAIVRRHGGTLALEDNPAGRGARFLVLLPVDAESAGSAPGVVAEEAAAPTPASTPALPALPGGNGRILLVDDEVMILSILSILLKRLGYDPVTTMDGQSGLNLYREAAESGRPFDAVILDATIPGGLGGEKALEAFLSYDPAAKVIICSGYSGTKVMKDWRELGFAGSIAKPFESLQIARLLREVLGGEGAAGS